jgi:outer membrane protein OmpA-like peptidoglycan-associated protein
MKEATLMQGRMFSIAGLKGFTRVTGLVLAAGLLLVLSAAVGARGVAHAGQVTAAAIVEALLPEKTGPVTRSMARSVTRGIDIEGELPPELDLPSISLTINFEFDSARLTNDGMLTLRVLGEALADKRLAGMQFQIAGHTDDVGTPQYNQDLSERRAKAVVTHLVSFYGIAPDRLKAVGYGETRLIVPNDPKAAANRRVEIINLAPLSS